MMLHGLSSLQAIRALSVGTDRLIQETISRGGLTALRLTELTEPQRGTAGSSGPIDSA